jgi:hypothetical protein
MLQLHGEVCDVHEVAKILKYPSAQALRRALSRSKAPIRLVKLPNRRGLFASTRDLARYLDNVFTEGSSRTKPLRRASR